jgi:hypothetical protein
MLPSIANSIINPFSATRFGGASEKLIVGDKILTYHMKDKFTIVFSHYDFNYGLRLSRNISSWHFSPEEQKPIYRPLALKGLRLVSHLHHGKVITHRRGYSKGEITVVK